MRLPSPVELASVFVAFGLAACGGSSVGGNGPCDTDPTDPRCTTECPGGDADCPTGSYCGTDSKCTADCSADGVGCASDQVCDSRGHCVAEGEAPDARPNDCPSVHSTPAGVTPTVQLLLDQSGSMTADFGNSTRYPAMTAALVDAADGVVTNLAGKVIFGASLYTWDEGDASCPRITSTAHRQIDNFQEVRDLLEGNQPVDNTPTGDSIDVIVNGFLDNPPPPNSPPIILLATDGEPDTCELPNPQQGQVEAVTAAKRAHDNGIDLYILSVGDEVSDDHLQDMANVGLGRPQADRDPATRAPFFKANDPAQLAAQLEAIIGGVLSCELEISGQVDISRADEAHVSINGGPNLVYGTDWEMVDANTMRLIGQTCTDYLASANPVVDAEFPCGVIIEYAIHDAAPAMR